MVFWVGILLSAAFAWFAVKRGFYEIWALLFNILISIYLAIFLRPTIVNIIPVSGNKAYNDLLCMIAIAAGSFLILHGISYIFITGQFNVPFARVFDIFGSGLLGFFTGFLIWSFASLLIFITPVSKNTFAKELGFSNQLIQSNVSYICWWCDLVNRVVSFRDDKHTTEQYINTLLKSREKKSPAKQRKDEAAEPNEPNNLENNLTEEKHPES